MSREEYLDHLTSKHSIYNHALMITNALSSFFTSSTSTSSVELNGNLVESDSGQHTAKWRSASPSRRRVHADGPNGPDYFGFLPGAVVCGYAGEVDGNLVESDSDQHIVKLRSATPSRRSVHADGPNGPNDFGFLPDHIQGAVGGGYAGEVDGNLVESDSGQHTAKWRSASPLRRRVDADGPNGPNDFGILPDYIPGALGGGYGGGDRMDSDKLMSLVMSLITGIQAEMTKKESMIHTLQDKVAHLEDTLSSKQNENEDRDFQLSLLKNSFFDGSMVWKIPQFSQHMNNARTWKYTSIFSLPFYSNRYSYKMCLRLYILRDGIGKGTHMSIFFVNLKGEFDNNLHWPFKPMMTFRLINQCGGILWVSPFSSLFQKQKQSQ